MLSVLITVQCLRQSAACSHHTDLAGLVPSCVLLLMTRNSHLHSILWFILLVFHNPVMKFGNIMFVLRIKELRFRRLSDLPEIMIASKWQSCNLNLDALLPNPHPPCGNTPSP